MIMDVSAHDGAEAFEVEEGVLEFERIEGPFDEIHTSALGIEALLELQSTTETSVAPGGKDAKHVAVEIRFAARFQAGDAKAKGDHTVVIEGSEDLAADLPGDNEEA